MLSFTDFIRWPVVEETQTNLTQIKILPKYSIAKFHLLNTFEDIYVCVLMCYDLGFLLDPYAYTTFHIQVKHLLFAFCSSSRAKSPGLSNRSCTRFHNHPHPLSQKLFFGYKWSSYKIHNHSGRRWFQIIKRPRATNLARCAELPCMATVPSKYRLFLPFI